jgi:precorrin-3B C17-methyltransferase
MSLYVVGLGPGGGQDLTLRAKTCLDHCEVILGYTTYLSLIRGDYPNKEYRSTPMRGEVERCRMALEAAQTKDAALVCSGDPGVYGMASLCYELAGEYPPIEITVIPGVTAATGGAAVLGAPLTHDFAVISLSDLMTPMEKIEARLDGAARADFVLCLYNPSSHQRKDYLKRACQVLLRSKSPDTPCGYVRNIGRQGEEAVIVTLAELADCQVDMFTTVFVGNAQTQVIDGKLVTPRGYLQR